MDAPDCPGRARSEPVQGEFPRNKSHQQSEGGRVPLCSDSWLACFDQQRAILKQPTPGIPATTNFMGFFKPLDYWRWAAHEDVVANDAYPEPSDPNAPIEAAMACDLMRSLRQGQPWLLMEQVTSHVNWRPRNTTKSVLSR